MAEVQPMIIDGADINAPVSNGPDQRKKALKRKRGHTSVCIVSQDEKQAKINGFREEINRLIKFCKDLVSEQRGALLENVEKMGVSSASLNRVIASLMEESELPLSKLVDDIFERVEGKCGNGDGVSKASVKNSVLLVGQRLCYGVSNADADILEDESESALWYWETRDLKLIPKSMRDTLKVRRKCRKKIQERITAVCAMITALEKPEDHHGYKQDLKKASDKLNKVLTEADVRLLMETNAAEVSEKEAKREVQQMEKSKRQMEKDRKKMDRELTKEKLHSEKELKRLQEEAEREERRLEKEESEMRKQLKRQQEEAEKEQRRKEKEEAEAKKRLALQRQASLMERFLKKDKADSASQNSSAASKQVTSDRSSKTVEKMSGSVTLVMDSLLTHGEGINAIDLWKSHLKSWHSLGHSVCSNRKMHWGIRQKPKTELVKELKLSTNRELTCDEDLEKLVDGWADSNVDGNSSTPPNSRKRSRSRQLLQFDKSHRPAFYGIWSKKSQVVGARHPFAKDPDLDYEIDSDEEWEEEEPGESLSDCDKDEEDETVEGHSKGDDEDESEDGFFVPDGYLSENEGVQDDEMQSDELAEARNLAGSSEQAGGSEEFYTLLRQQKYLNNLTDHALRKNQPLIILNLMHEKANPLPAECLTDIQKLEQKCLQSLSIRPCPGCPSIEISVCNDTVNEDQEASPPSKSSTTQVGSAAAILNSDLAQIVSVIQSCSQSIGRVLESLHNKFPTIPKTQLRNKVREIAEFSDNRWQVKKEILLELGLSPEKSCGKTKSIAKFFSKRCLPPSGRTSNLNEASPQTSHKAVATTQLQQDSTVNNQ